MHEVHAVVALANSLVLGGRQINLTRTLTINDLVVSWASCDTLLHNDTSWLLCWNLWRFWWQHFTIIVIIWNLNALRNCYHGLVDAAVRWLEGWGIRTPSSNSTRQAFKLCVSSICSTADTPMIFHVAIQYQCSSASRLLAPVVCI